MTSFRDWMLDGEWCSTCLFRITHRCSIGFRSEDILGHWISTEHTHTVHTKSLTQLSPLPAVVLREATAREKDPRRSNRINERPILPPADWEKERGIISGGIEWVWKQMVESDRLRVWDECERGSWRKYRRRKERVEVERRRHGAKREAEGQWGTDQKQHLWTDGPFEQLISSSRFTVSLPRRTKWVTRGRVPSLTQPTDLLNICINVRALPSLPHQYSLSALLLSDSTKAPWSV